MSEPTGSARENPRTEVWGLLMSRIAELVPNAKADELRLLTRCFSDLNR